MDNGPEMTSHEFTGWAASQGIELRYIQPGEPNQNAYNERFNRTYRHEVLDAYLFKSIEQVQQITEEWLREYNEQRPHDALGGIPPRQFLPRLTTDANSSKQLSTCRGSFRMDHYNAVRPNSSLGYRTPQEFVEQFTPKGVSGEAKVNPAMT